MKKEQYSNDDIINFFEDAGYSNIEIIGDRIIFTTGEDVNNWSIEEAIKFLVHIKRLNEKETIDYCPGCNVAYCQGRYTTGQCE